MGGAEKGTCVTQLALKPSVLFGCCQVYLETYICCIFSSVFFVAPEGTYPNGIRGVLIQLMREEGILALYKGVTPVMLRAFPANAVSVLQVYVCCVSSGKTF